MTLRVIVNFSMNMFDLPTKNRFLVATSRVSDSVDFKKHPEGMLDQNLKDHKKEQCHSVESAHLRHFSIILNPISNYNWVGYPLPEM